MLKYFWPTVAVFAAFAWVHLDRRATERADHDAAIKECVAHGQYLDCTYLAINERAHMEAVSNALLETRDAAWDAAAASGDTLSTFLCRARRREDSVLERAAGMRPGASRP